MSLNKKLSDEQIIELTLKGAPKIKEMKNIQFDKFYHCYYYYFESGDDTTSMIKKEEGWYYPDLQKHIKGRSPQICTVRHGVTLKK